MSRQGRRQFLARTGIAVSLATAESSLSAFMEALAYAGPRSAQLPSAPAAPGNSAVWYNTNLQTAVGLGDEPAGILDNFGQLKTRHAEVRLEIGSPPLAPTQGGWTQSLHDGYLPIVTTERRAAPGSLRWVAFTSQVDDLKADYLGIEEAKEPYRITLWFPYTTSIRADKGIVTSGDKVLAMFVPPKALTVSQARYNYLTPEAGTRFSLKPLPGVDPAFNRGRGGILNRGIEYRFPVPSGKAYHVCLGLRMGQPLKPGEMLLRLSVNGESQVVDMGVVETDKPLLREFVVSAGTEEIRVKSECDPSSTSPYRASLLNGIWILDAPANLEAVQAGKLSEKACFYVQCGREPKHEVASSVVLEYEPQESAAEPRWIRLPYDWSGKNSAPAAAISTSAARTAAEKRWNSLLHRGAEFTSGVKALDDLYKTSLFNIFLLRTKYSGAANHGQDLYVVKPGATGYDAFWYRDGAYLVAALDRAGYAEEAEKSLRLFWQTNLQGIFASYGQQKCGVWQAPITEWDGQGQALWALAHHFQMTGDKDWLRAVYPSIRKGALWIKNVTEQTQIVNEHGEKPYYFGLLPAGEGEAIGGGYQYYHNYWAIFGLRQAILSAHALGQEADAAWMNQCLDEFSANLLASVKEAYRRVGNSEFIPATPFDPQMDIWGAIAALYPCRFLDAHDPMMTRTLDHIARNSQEDEYTFFVSKVLWTYMTADWAMCYLLRNEVPMFYRLFNGYVAHASPTHAWIEEIVLASRVGTGDMPHGWAAAQYVHLHRNSLVYEDGNKLELGWGVQPDWLRVGANISVKRAPTKFGEMHFDLRRAESGLILDFRLTPMPGQETAREIRLHIPELQEKISSVRVNGKIRYLSPGESVIHLDSKL